MGAVSLKEAGKDQPPHPESMSGSPEYKGQGSLAWVGGHPHSGVSSISALQGGILKERNGDLQAQCERVGVPRVEGRGPTVRSRGSVVEGRD